MNEIYLEIERLRRDLIFCAEIKGLTDPLVLDISKRIDYYHNVLLMLKKHEEQKSRFSSGKVYEDGVRYAV